MKKLLSLIILIAISIGLAKAESSELIIDGNSVKIGGTFSGHTASSASPLVILISGSGAQDRDETIFGHKPFALIAEELEGENIPSFRYDDRSVGESTGDFGQSTLQDLSADVIAIMDYFQNSAENTYNEFILLGHSQGGVVAGQVAAMDERVKGIVLMASPTLLLKDVITGQVIAIQKKSGKSEDNIKLVVDMQEALYDAVTGKADQKTAKDKFRKLIEYEMMAVNPAQLAQMGGVDGIVEGQFPSIINGPINSPQMKSLLFYNPMRDIQKIDIPVLAIFGGKDTQVHADENKKPLESIAANNADIQIKVIENANHLFQKAESGQASEYPTLPKVVMPEFTNAVIAWYKSM